MDWKDYFSEQVLEKSKSLTKNKIKMFKEDEHYYYAKIHGTVLYDLMLSKDYKKISCTCPYIDSGRRCKHMAFFLRYINRNHKKIDINVVSNDYLRIDFDFKKNKLKNIVVDNDELINFIVYNTGLKEELVQECIDLENKFLKENGLIVEDVKDLNKDDSSNIVIKNEEVAKYIIKHKQTDLTQEDIFSCLDYEVEYLRYLGVIRENESGETIIAVNYEKLKYDKEYIINVLKNRGLQFFNKTNKDIKNDLEFIKHLIDLFGYDILKYCNSSILKQFRDDKTFEKHINSLPTKTFNPQIKTLTGLWGEQYNDNEEQALYVIRNYKDTEFNNVSERLRNDRNFVLKVMQINGLLLQNLADKFKDDDEIVFTAVKDNRLAFEYASERLRNNKELALLAVKKDGQPLSWIGKELSNDKEIVLTAIDNWGASLGAVGKELCDDKEVIMKAVERVGWNLAYASNRLKDDIEVVKMAIKDDYYNLEYASNRLKNSEEIALYMLENDCYNRTFIFLGTELIQNKDFINKIIKDYPDKLEILISDIFYNISHNEDIIKMLVEFNGKYLRYASSELSRNKDIVKKALETDENNILYADIELLRDNSFINSYIKNDDLHKAISKKIEEHDIKDQKKKSENYFEWLVEKCNVTIRLYKVLNKNNILSKEKVLSLTEEEFLKLKNANQEILEDFKSFKENIKKF